MIDREELLERHPLTEYLQDKGIQFKRNGKHLITNICPIQDHKPGHLCVSILPEKQCWNCNDHSEGGSIIDWIVKETGKSIKTVMNELAGVSALPDNKNHVQRHVEPGKAILEATYDYTDESGKLLYQVCRYRPKTFKQRQPDEFGGWTWGLEGVTRVLFNLPAVMTSQEVFVVEGEKDALALIAMKYVATTSAGGAKNWLFAYGDTLKGKDVIIIPDNDEPGDDYARSVIESLSEKANSIKRLHLPHPAKDSSDFIRGFADLRSAKAAMDDLISRTPHVIAPLPLYSIKEMETRYRKFVRRLKEKSVNLGSFLPGLAAVTRNLIPGEVVLILAKTGVGKTAIAQSICRAASPQPTLFFELELPLELLFERFAQIEIGCHGQDVEDDYRQNDDSYAEHWKGLNHVLTCPQSGLTAAEIEKYILRSELKFGRPPVLVCIDYIGLMKGEGRSRYEKVSENAEQLKVIAKNTGTIIVMTSQVGRPGKDKENLEVTLHDGKESGSLENSAGLVIGCWRPEPDQLTLKILKNTRGPSGAKIECDFDGAKMQITERVKKKGESKSPEPSQEEWDMN